MDCCRHKNHHGAHEAPSIIFSFGTKDLFEEVTKRTSYLGKMRVNVDNVHNLDGTDNINENTEANALDRLAFTDGEDFMFSEMLDEAASETYDWVRAFGRNIVKAFRVEWNSISHRLYENKGLLCSINDVKTDLSTQSPVPATFTFDGMQGTFICTLDNAIKLKAYENLKYEYSLHVFGKRREWLGGSEEEIYTFNSGEISLNEGATNNITSFSFRERVVYDLRLEVKLESVDRASRVNIKEGEFVEYCTFKEDTTGFVTDLYQVSEDCDDVNWNQCAEFLPIDTRDKVTFILDYPFNFDPNLIKPIERHLKEAIVCFIIYRWLEYTKPDEAERWYDRFDEHGRQAQLAMNSEQVVMKRRYNWY